MREALFDLVFVSPSMAQNTRIAILICLLDLIPSRKHWQWLSFTITEIEKEIGSWVRKVDCQLDAALHWTNYTNSCVSCQHSCQHSCKECQEENVLLLEGQRLECLITSKSEQSIRLQATHLSKAQQDRTMTHSGRQSIGLFPRTIWIS